MKRFGGKKSRRKYLTAGTHGCGGGRSRQAPVKMAPAPSAYTTAAPTVKHFRVINNRCWAMTQQKGEAHDQVQRDRR